MTNATMKPAIKIAVIGGTGLNKPEIIKDSYETVVDTPFGKPSDALICGQICGVDCILLCRHGRHHTISPTNVNYRANIWALKEAGCTHVIASTACGSLQENIRPGDLVFLDQFIDRTCKRQNSFYDGAANSPKGICHIPMDEPFCPHTRKILIESAKELNIRHHPAGTNVTIEGPRFSTRAESRLFKSWGAHTVNMTTVPEAILAKEVGLAYAAIALVTDYDCWRESEEGVNKDVVMNMMKENAVTLTKLITDAFPKLAAYDFSKVLKVNMAHWISDKQELNEHVLIHYSIQGKGCNLHPILIL